MRRRTFDHAQLVGHHIEGVDVGASGDALGKAFGVEISLTTLARLRLSPQLSNAIGNTPTGVGKT